ncbi:uncharacterized protein LOC141719998 [Apium graveolens]|uniref:uncharacterized protein LOC141719998 n=1 Tax=Apium graveolens TaxID=4045 RepID=UPI003D7B4039
MSLLAWNCRGLGKPRTIHFLKELTQQIKPNIIFLSETLAKHSRIIEVCKALNYADCWSVDAQGHSGGLALLWKNEGGCVVTGSTKHYVDFEVANDHVGRWRYTGFYVCPERGRRHESWELIRDLARKSNLPWCIIGDFNDMMSADEKRGGRPQPYNLLQGFTEVVDACGLTDLGFIGEKYMWEKSRGSCNWVQERLDRGLATQDWCNLFPQAEVQVLEVATSDHLPLYLQLNKKVYRRKERRFRFENSWLRESECEIVVKNGWNEAVELELMAKINFCGLKLQEWGGGISCEYKKKGQEYRYRLRKLRSRRDRQGINEYNGDADGVWQESTEGIHGAIEGHFSQLFESTNIDGKLTERETVQQISDIENEDLIAPITVEEVKNTVFSMHPDKSPGPDGFNPAFFRSFWSVVGVDVVRFCQVFMTTGTLREGVNHSLVCLIPKVKTPQTCADLRPISLCNVLARILSKVLSNRLKQCLKSIVSDKQSAFIEGRLLTDNAMLAFEINHYMKRRTQGKNGLAALKIDISKAYDRLE